MPAYEPPPFPLDLYSPAGRSLVLRGFQDGSLNIVDTKALCAAVIGHVEEYDLASSHHAGQTEARPEILGQRLNLCAQTETS